jgi:urease accessory protein
LRFEQRAGATVLRRRQEGGSLRVRVPRRLDAGVTEAVVINTSGGMCGGDTIVQDVTWGQGTSAVLTTQASEKVYGSLGPACTIATHLDVGAGARAEWLPQETILFDGAHMRRDTCIDLAEDAVLLWSESIVFGRLARGESVERGALRDRVRIRRGGRLVHADVTALGGDDARPGPAAQLARAALGDGARGCAVLLGSGGDLPLSRDAVRRELERHPEVLAGASAWNGLLSVRLLARDPAAMRVALAAVLGVLRPGDELPRVWRC